MFQFLKFSASALSSSKSSGSSMASIEHQGYPPIFKESSKQLLSIIIHSAVLQRTFIHFDMHLCMHLLINLNQFLGEIWPTRLWPGSNHCRTLFDEQRVPNLAGDSAVMHDIHCVSSVLKLYFRDLPTPLVTYDLYPHLVLASKQSEARRGDKYREILQRLPGAHYRYVASVVVSTLQNKVLFDELSAVSSWFPIKSGANQPSQSHSTITTIPIIPQNWNICVMSHSCVVTWDSCFQDNGLADASSLSNVSSKWAHRHDF